MSTNAEKFQTILQDQYAQLFERDPDYAYSKSQTTPEALAKKMTLALAMGHANKDGKAVKRACKVLGLKYTYVAIAAYLRGET